MGHGAGRIQHNRYAGPDIAPLEESADRFPNSKFRPAEDVLAGPRLDLDFLQQRGTQSSSVSRVARQSLYVIFNPLIGGWPSVTLYRAGQRDLINTSSPNPCKPDRDPSQQNSSLLKDEEAERREREFPDRPGEECSEGLANDFIWVSVRLEVVFLFLDRS